MELKCLFSFFEKQITKRETLTNISKKKNIYIQISKRNKTDARIGEMEIILRENHI